VGLATFSLVGVGRVPVAHLILLGKALLPLPSIAKSCIQSSTSHQTSTIRPSVCIELPSSQQDYRISLQSRTATMSSALDRSLDDILAERRQVCYFTF
jgi:hypothetical protein